MSSLRAEDGFTLIELLTAMALFMFILGATLTTFDGFVSRSATNTRLNESADEARTSMERLAQQVRNLASPTTANTNSIEMAGAYDFVFKTVDASKRRVRYCLNSSNPAKSTLWVQTQTFALGSADPGIPTTTACPAAVTANGWQDQRVAAAEVVNRYGGAERPVFYYPGFAGAADTSTITVVRAQLFIDTDPTRVPGEIAVSTGDFLRNQNQKPVVPDFTSVRSPLGSSRLILNGSQATDPEGRTLQYVWYKGSGSGPESLPSCANTATQTGGGYTCLGTGLTLEHVLPAGASGPQTITLKVIDPGGLSATFTKGGQ